MLKEILEESLKNTPRNLMEHFRKPLRNSSDPLGTATMAKNTKKGLGTLIGLGVNRTNRQAEKENTRTTRILSDS